MAWGGGWRWVGAEGLGPQHQNPTGQPAGYKAYSRLSLGQLTRNLRFNQCSWEGDPLYPMRPSVCSLTAMGLSHWTPHSTCQHGS